MICELQPVPQKSSETFYPLHLQEDIKVPTLCLAEFPPDGGRPSLGHVCLGKWKVLILGMAGGAPTNLQFSRGTPGQEQLGRCKPAPKRSHVLTAASNPGSASPGLLAKPHRRHWPYRAQLLPKSGSENDMCPGQREVLVLHG